MERPQGIMTCHCKEYIILRFDAGQHGALVTRVGGANFAGVILVKQTCG